MTTRRGVLLAGAGLAIFGLVRLIFNASALRVFGPSFVGAANHVISSAAIASLLAVGALRVTASKFISEAVGAGDNRRAGIVFSLVGLTTLASGWVVSLLFFSLAQQDEVRVLCFYGLVFPSYGLAKSVYYAFGKPGLYCRAEILGFIAFLALFGLACAAGSRHLAGASFLAHPMTVAAASLLHLRTRLRWSGVGCELRRSWRKYLGFHGATTINVVTSLGTFHVVVVLAAAVLQDDVQVGYLSVILAALAPLNLVSAALGSALFPRIARHFGENDIGAQRRLTRDATLALHLLLVPGGVILLGFPRFFVHMLGLPPTAETVQTWTWLVFSALLPILSSPCGHSLNATRYAAQHAVLGLVFFSLGVGFGIHVLGTNGLVGAGVMRCLGSGLAGWGRMALAEVHFGWSSGIRSYLIPAHCALFVLFVVALAGAGWEAGTALIVLAQVLHVPYLWIHRRLFLPRTASW